MRGLCRALLTNCFGLALFISLVSFTGCSGGSSSVPVPGTVTVKASASTVDGTDTTTLSATVTNSSAGVSWSTSTGSLSSQTATSATFTAPAATSAMQTVTITATSSADSSIRGTATITIPSAPEVISTNASLDGAVGGAYALQLQGSGGIPPYRNWSVSSSGHALPSCLTLSASGILTTASGTALTASCAGTYSSIIFTFADSGTPKALTATSAPMTITIQPAAPIVFLGEIAATATEGQAYATTYAALAGGGVGSLTYGLAAGSSLPPGLTLNGVTGGISGTPTAVGTYNFTISAADAYGDSGSKAYSIVVSSQAVSLPAAGSHPLPSGIVGETYSGSISATGGAGGSNYEFVVNGTAIPVGGAATTIANGDGLTASNNGSNVLTFGGDPSAAETSLSLTVEVIDTTKTSDTATVAYTIVVNPSPLTVTLNSVPQGMANMPYTYANLSVSGGTSPYTVTYSGLPAGLEQASASPDQIVGTPSSAGSSSVTVDATDSSTPTAEQDSAPLTLSVVAETATTNDAELSAQYACYVDQFWPSGVKEQTGSTLYRGGMVFAFTSNGSGVITGGQMDSNGPSNGFLAEGFTGTYAVGSDNRGYLELKGSNNLSALFALAGGDLNSSNQFSRIALTEMDDAGTSPSGVTGSGRCYLQSSSPTVETANYVFLLRGEWEDGSLAGAVGSIDFSSSSSTGTMDAVIQGSYTADETLTGSSLTPEGNVYGAATFNSFGSTSSSLIPVVMFPTGDAAGDAVFISDNPHDDSTGADFVIGQARLQKATSVPAGPAVIYASGQDSAQGYAATAMQFANGEMTQIENNAGTISSKSLSGVTFDADATTGRTTESISGQAAPGVVLYVYNSNAAAYLDAASSSSQSSDWIGWMEPQAGPSSGGWTVDDLAASYFMGSVANGDPSRGSSSGILSVSSDGDISPFAQDKGSQNDADWDEGLSGAIGVTASGMLAPDTTYDPTASVGIFVLNVMQSTGTLTKSYCFAIRQDQAASNSSTHGRLACLSADGTSPQVTVVQQ